jgi:hypothetical protein
VTHLGDFLGPNKGVTDRQNTTLSAVATLNDVGPEVSLDVFQNRHAAIRLDPALLRHHRIRHHQLAYGSPGQRPWWTEVELEKSGS